jgi:hypothetical protein
VANIQVRNVPPHVHAVLKERAADEGLSLSEYLLSELTQLAELPTTAELMERIRSRELFSFDVSNAELIRQDRESH